jgi:hypothetical protein
MQEALKPGFFRKTWFLGMREAGWRLEVGGWRRREASKPGFFRKTWFLGKEEQEAGSKM